MYSWVLYIVCKLWRVFILRSCSFPMFFPLEFLLFGAHLVILWLPGYPTLKAISTLFFGGWVGEWVWDNWVNFSSWPWEDHNLQGAITFHDLSLVSSHTCHNKEKELIFFLNVSNVLNLVRSLRHIYKGQHYSGKMDTHLHLVDFHLYKAWFLSEQHYLDSFGTPVTHSPFMIYLYLSLCHLFFELHQKRKLYLGWLGKIKILQIPWKIGYCSGKDYGMDIDQCLWMKMLLSTLISANIPLQ